MNEASPTLLAPNTSEGEPQRDGDQTENGKVFKEAARQGGENKEVCVCVCEWHRQGTSKRVRRMYTNMYIYVCMHIRMWMYLCI